MTDLERALYSDAANDQNRDRREAKERENSYLTLTNMVNMLKEFSRENRDLPIPLFNERPSRKIEDRYGIPSESKFSQIWVIIERVCNGEYILKKEEDVVTK